MREHSEAALRVRGLRSHYGDFEVLHEVDATFAGGKITVVAGRSGCGKTTLLRNVLRLINPTSGTIELFGRDISELEEDELVKLRPRIGVLFQNGALLQSLTVGANISVPLEQHTRLPADVIERIVLRKLQLVELNGIEHLMPSELSGGMRKRAALARTLALDPEIVFFDEPSAGLDPVTAASLDRLIVELSRKLGITVIVVTHELTSIRRIADRMLFLDAGRAVFEGTVEEAEMCPVESVRQFFAQGSSEPPARRSPDEARM